MALELVAAVVFGFGMAGVVMLLRRLAPSLVPRFMIPAAAGAAMIGFTVWSEYAWFDRQTADLPDTVAIASTHTEASPLRPWTYVQPFVNRFVAVDLAGARRNAAAPGQVIVDVFVVQRYAPTATAPVLIDCAGSRRADIADGVDFGSDGQVLNPDWRAVGADDPLVSAVCAAS